MAMEGRFQAESSEQFSLHVSLITRRLLESRGVVVLSAVGGQCLQCREAGARDTPTYASPSRFWTIDC
jgi:hypothetical protein